MNVPQARKVRSSYVYSLTIQLLLRESLSIRVLESSGFKRNLIRSFLIRKTSVVWKNTGILRSSGSGRAASRPSETSFLERQRTLPNYSLNVVYTHT